MTFDDVSPQSEALFQAWSPPDPVSSAVEHATPAVAEVGKVSMSDEEDYDDDDEEEGREGKSKGKTYTKFSTTIGFSNAVVDIYEKKAVSRQSTLIFSASLAGVAALVTAFTAAGIKVRAISSLTSAHERVDIMSDFKDGKFPVLINCLVLTEGADMPAVSYSSPLRDTSDRV